MKEVKDKFSNQAAAYKNARPKYPKELIEIILNATENRTVCWDCATGNGQVAGVLAAHFNEVYATDLSSQQLAQAERKTNIVYKEMRAEKTTFPDDSFDLITVAQAMHWFDFDAFNEEANRLLKDDGTICVWGYGPLKMQGVVGDLVNKFYTEVVGGYWDKERNHINEGYKNVTFDFTNVRLINHLAIVSDWTIDNVAGYFNSWSSVQNYKRINNEDPVPAIMKEIAEVWAEATTHKAVLPIFMKIGNRKKP